MPSTRRQQETNESRAWRILTTIHDFGKYFDADIRVQVTRAPYGRGRIRHALYLLFNAHRYDAIVYYNPGREVLGFALQKLVLGRRTAALVAVDKVFTNPGSSWLNRLRGRLIGLVWRRVDLYLLPSKNSSELESVFGIPRRQFEFMPFKVNDLEKLGCMDTPDGGYVFTGGRSQRDFGTFCRAMTGLPYRAVILTPRGTRALDHGTVFDDTSAPKNVEVIHDDGSIESWNRYIAQCSFAVFPISSDTISPSGVGAYLVAMALRKCVIITECPATRDVLSHEVEAVIVPPNDPRALADAIDCVGRDEAYRNQIAKKGYEYAMSLGSRVELMQRIANATVQHLQRPGA